MTRINKIITTSIFAIFLTNLASAQTTYQCKSHVDIKGDILGITLKTEINIDKTVLAADGETQLPFGFKVSDIKNNKIDTQYKLEIQIRETGSNKGETLCDALLINQQNKVVAASRTDRSRGGIQDQNICILHEFENTESIHAVRSAESINTGTPILVNEVHCWKNE